MSDKEWKEPPASFVARVAMDARGCWMWKGAVDKNGYGLYHLRKAGLRRAHRLSWELANGPIPKGQFICHACDTPGCVRPSHLFAGTAKQNAEDRDTKRHGPHGDNNPRSRLTAADVAKIRSLRRTTKPRVIAKMYGVTSAYIWEITSGKRWACIEPEIVEAP